jgi:hypothetical protein
MTASRFLGEGLLIRGGEGFCVDKKLVEGRAIKEFATQDDGVDFAGLANVLERVGVE